MECFVVSTTSALIPGSSSSSSAIATVLIGGRAREPVGNHLTRHTNQAEQQARRERLFINHAALEDKPSGFVSKRSSNPTTDRRKMFAFPSRASTARWTAR